MLNGLIEKATREPDLDLYQKLLEHGLDLQDEKIADEAVSKVFSYATASREVMDFLFANNVSKSSLVKKLNSTILGKVEILEQILDYGIDINAHNSTHNTVLVALLELTSAKPEILTMLLNYGAEPNLKGRKDMPPLIALMKRINTLTYSKLNNFVEFTGILLEYGADPAYVYEGKNALDILQEQLKNFMDKLSKKIEDTHHLHSTYNNYNSKATLEHNIATIRQMIDLLIASGAKPSEDVADGDDKL